MAENVQEQLLGYLLDALEDDERQTLREQLSLDAHLRQQLASLREMIRPLEATRDDCDPPWGLAQRTCRLVADSAVTAAASIEERPVASLRLHELNPDVSLVGGTSRISWFDVTAATGILIAASLLIFPALQSSRNKARIAGCQQNLRLVHESLGHYSDSSGGLLPVAAPTSRLAVGGGFASVLRSQGYLNDPRVLLCPSSPLAGEPDFDVPPPDRLMAMPEGKALDAALARLGGSYSMTFGHQENGRYRGLRNEGRNEFAWLSDVPNPDEPNFLSHNHGEGQNVLFEAGHVRYLKIPFCPPGSDHYYLNAAHVIGPGLNRHDSVIPPAGRVPIVLAGMR